MRVENGNNILLVDKPKGVSSFDVIRKLRDRLGVDRNSPQWKMGHAGTLDPLASGLLIIGVSVGTRKLSEYLKLPKTYETDILIGVRTTTGDREGRVVEQHEGPIDLSEDTVRQALESMVGELVLPVPTYSAVKRGGEPLYKKARRGEEVIAPRKLMRVHEAHLLRISEAGGRPVVRARFVVGSGTYIRSLAEELGARLDHPATVQELRRTRIGTFDVVDAHRV